MTDDISSLVPPARIPSEKVGLPRLLGLGLLAAALFSITFVLNRAMSLDGGNWVWSASLRYFDTAVLLGSWLLLRRGARYLGDVLRLFRRRLTFWLLAGGIGFRHPFTHAAALPPTTLPAGLSRQLGNLRFSQRRLCYAHLAHPSPSEEWFSFCSSSQAFWLSYATAHPIQCACGSNPGWGSSCFSRCLCFPTGKINSSIELNTSLATTLQYRLIQRRLSFC